MKTFFGCLFIGIVTFVWGIGIGQNIGKQDSQKQIEQLQTALDTCKTTCAKEFEKMGC